MISILTLGPCTTLPCTAVFTLTLLLKSLTKFKIFHWNYDSYIVSLVLPIEIYCK